MMKIALQMFSVRSELTKDPAGTMRAVAEMGYHNWETFPFDPNNEWNYGIGLPLAEAKSLLKDLGITIVGNHLMQPDLVPENRDELKRNLDYQAEIGCESPGLAAIFVPDLNGVLECCEHMNAAAELCRERGMRFHFHNHWHEFQLMEGEKYMMDIIMENTDPSLVDMEVDTYWATRAGMDPVEVMYRYKDRLTMLHQKDIKAEALPNLDFFAKRDRHEPVMDVDLWRQITQPYQKDYCEVGTGIMDIQRIIDAGNDIGCRYITLEQDYTDRTEMESVRLSLANFRKYTGLDWEGR